MPTSSHFRDLKVLLDLCCLMEASVELRFFNINNIIVMSFHFVSCRNWNNVTSCVFGLGCDVDDIYRYVRYYWPRSYLPQSYFADHEFVCNHTEGTAAYVSAACFVYVTIRVAPNFGFGFSKFEIRPFFPNSAKFGFGQISGRIWPNLADANATAVRSVSYLITDKN